jgi:hypothetical protein
MRSVLRVRDTVGDTKQGDYIKSFQLQFGMIPNRETGVLLVLPEHIFL